MPRPVSLTVILWIIIALALEGLIGLIGPFANAVTTTIASKLNATVPHVAWSGAIWLVAQVVLAALMLRGIALARVVYVCVVAYIALSLLRHGAFPFITAVSVTKSAIFIYFLFRPESNRFFAAGGPLGAAGNTGAA